MTAESYHLQFWQESINWLHVAQFLESRGIVYCVDGWRLILSALVSLWQEISSDLKFLSTRRLNQDCLESYFSSICQKGCCRDNPSACYFRSAMRQRAANSLLVSHDGGICDTDDDSGILSLQALSAKRSSKAVTTGSHSPKSTDSVSSQSSAALVHTVEETGKMNAVSVTSVYTESSLVSFNVRCSFSYTTCNLHSSTYNVM